MSEKIQYLTENHYLTCSKGTMPKRVKIDSQDFVKFSGTKVATVKDKQTKNNFTCAGSVVFKAGAAVGLACALIPGPGWVVAIAIAAIVAVAAIMAVRKCKAAASSRFWIPETVEKNTKINGKSLLTIDSCMECPAEGGTIKAKATLWEAWGSQIWTNLGHLANFAFGFLVGRGAGAMVSEGATAYGAASSGGASATSALGTAVRATGQSFLNTAKKELVSQFNPFGNWKGKSWICNGLRGFGLFGAYKQHYDTWTDDEKTITEKLEATAVSLILDVFAAKGMTFVCFPAGTKVYTQWGLANIESLEEGIEVLTYNEETGEKEYKPILKTTKRTTSRMCIVELSNGETLRVTPEHRFYSDGKWVPIEEFEIGDLLETKEDVYLVIENKAIITTLVEVFNLEIEGNENYYVTQDGILVHNGCGKPEAGSPEHKQQRWEDYQNNGGEWDYERWSKTYDANMQNALKGNAGADAYHNELGWGKREVTVQVDINGNTVNRRLDIADVPNQRGVEVKTGDYFSRTEDIMSEIGRDKQLVRDGWDIEWRIDGNASGPLLDELKDAGIKVNHTPKK